MFGFGRGFLLSRFLSWLWRWNILSLSLLELSNGAELLSSSFLPSQLVSATEAPRSGDEQSLSLFCVLATQLRPLPSRFFLPNFSSVGDELISFIYIYIYIIKYKTYVCHKFNWWCHKGRIVFAPLPLPNLPNLAVTFHHFTPTLPLSVSLSLSCPISTKVMSLLIIRFIRFYIFWFCTSKPIWSWFNVWFVIVFIFRFDLCSS